MKTIISIILAVFSLNSFSDRICIGTLDEVGVGKWSEPVYLYSKGLFGDSDGRKLCSLKETYQNISPELCKSMYSLVLTAHVSEKPIVLDYDSTNNTKTCHERLTWSSWKTPIQIKIK